MTSDPEVLFERRGSVGLMTLNRPQALNALTLGMSIAMARQLAGWADDKNIALVVVRGAGDRAFCAGGDLRALYASSKAGTSYASDFYPAEYRLDTQIKEYAKPYVALIDGIAMGGGVGISVHGSHRIAGDRTVFAMPEVDIGFFPDVGGTYFLPRLPGRLGLFLGLTGARLKAADACYVGVATHYVPSDLHDDFIRALAETGDADTTCARFAAEPGQAPLSALREPIDRLFAPSHVEDILAALKRDETRWNAMEREITRKSPTSLKITARQLAEGARLSFRDCMRLEYRITCRVMEGHDFFEGVRATVIDKDRTPLWRPARLDEVSEADIDAYFAPLGARELTF